MQPEKLRIFLNEVDKKEAKDAYEILKWSATKIANRFRIKTSYIQGIAKKEKWSENEINYITRKDIAQNFQKNIIAIENEIRDKHKGIPKAQHISAIKELLAGIAIMEKEDYAYIIMICEELMIYASNRKPNLIKDVQKIIKGFVDEKVFGR